MIPIEPSSVTASMLRNWTERESIGEVLQALGLPAAMDSSHTIVRGRVVESLMNWIVPYSDERLAAMLRRGVGDRFDTGLENFVASMPVISIRHLVSPGVVSNGRSYFVDGASMSITFLAGGLSSGGPTAYVVPVKKMMLNNGSEWRSMVALVPMDALNQWELLVNAAYTADRFMMNSGQEMFVYNGSNYRIAPVDLQTVSMTETVKRDFVDDLTGFMTRRSWYQERSIPWSRKYVLAGPPGVGKTTLARWACTGLGMTPLSLDFTDRYADGRTFTGLLNYAASCAPSIILLDDFEKVLDGDNGTRISQHAILTALSGASSMDGVVIVATANSTGPFSGPMRRRFDRLVQFEYPSVDEIIKYIQSRLQSDPIDWKYITARLSTIINANPWSYDDARSAISAAASESVTYGRTAIGTADLVVGIESITAGRSA